MSHARRSALTLALTLTACGDDGTTATTATTSGMTVPQGTTGNATTAPTGDPPPTSTTDAGTAGGTGTGTSPTTSDGSTTDPSQPSNPSGPMTTDASTGSASTTEPAECDEGTEQCKRGGHQVCKNGVYVDVPCQLDEYCDERSDSCVACACVPGSVDGCADADNLNVCNDSCEDYGPVPCEGGNICVDGACLPLLCVPNEVSCADNDTVQECNGTGTAFGPPVDCAQGEVCSAGQCLSACELAQSIKSNVGCEFYAVDLTNLPPRDTFVYAVAVSNPSFTVAANVQIFDRNNNNNEQMIVQGAVPPRQVVVFNLSGTNNGKMGYYTGDAGILGNGIREGRAFRVASDYPIVATQFNPIGGASGFTTDASLLLPTHVLAVDYLHLAWHNGYGSGSTMVVAATQDATTVTITPKVAVAAGGGLPALPANVPTQIMLDRYDYAQLTVPPGQDLTGSVITSSAPVAVFGGHSCANVPNTNVTACDHVEEQIFPLETWGKSYIASRNPKRSVEAAYWRILASEDNTTVNFDPPTTIGAQIVMNKGQLVEFQEQNDFAIDADDPILVAGYMLGCTSTGLPNNPGDPYMTLMIPNEQFQTEYVFLVDSSYEADFAKLVRPTGAQINVACLGVVPENRWTPIGNSGYDWASINMNPGEANCKVGTNEATSASPFGIIVVGQAAAASYGYPGGLALKPINPQ